MLSKGLCTVNYTGSMACSISAYFGVHSWWVWETSDDHSSAIHVCKVQTFTDLRNGMEGAVGGNRTIKYNSFKMASLKGGGGGDVHPMQ